MIREKIKYDKQKEKKKFVTSRIGMNLVLN